MTAQDLRLHREQIVAPPANPHRMAELRIAEAVRPLLEREQAPATQNLGLEADIALRVVALELRRVMLKAPEGPLVSAVNAARAATSKYVEEQPALILGKRAEQERIDALSEKVRGMIKELGVTPPSEVLSPAAIRAMRGTTLEDLRREKETSFEVATRQLAITLADPDLSELKSAVIETIRISSERARPRTDQQVINYCGDVQISNLPVCQEQRERAAANFLSDEPTRRFRELVREMVREVMDPAFLTPLPLSAEVLNSMRPGEWKLVGRSPGADIRSEDPTVSRKHLLIRRTESGEWNFAGIGPSSTTLIGDAPIKHHTTYLTQGGHVLRLGDVAISLSTATDKRSIKP